MKPTRLSFLCTVLLAGTALAQAPNDTGTATSVNSAQTQPSGSARDGFTLRGAELVVTLKGVTTKVEREMKLSDGTRVLASGNIIKADGSSTALRPNQILLLNGTFQDALLDSNGVAAVSSVAPDPTPKAAVGISARDGITVSGADLLLTRNGVTEKVTSEVRLPNGIIANSDGSITLSNGNKIVLRANQVLDLNGTLHDSPVSNAPVPGALPTNR